MALTCTKILLVSSLISTSDKVPLSLHDLEDGNTAIKHFIEEVSILQYVLNCSWTNFRAF
jgi:hypothetical protein